MIDWDEEEALENCHGCKHLHYQCGFYHCDKFGVLCRNDMMVQDTPLRVESDCYERFYENQRIL